jgi:hypothetical protein
MADEKEAPKKEEKKEKKEGGVLSSLMRKKKSAEAEVDGTENMKEEIVTAKMVEPPTEELVKAGEEIPAPRPKSKAISKDADTEKPMYRKNDKFRLATRPGGVKKYFDR